MNELATRGFAASAVLCLTVATASAQNSFPETEPNGPKVEANIVNCMRAGDTLTGTTTGTSITAGSSLSTTADTFRIRTCALPPCIYRHRLVITTTGTAGHVGTIRGLSQVGGVPQAGTDVAMQTSLTTSTPPRYNEWYAFGRSEEIYYRVTGTASTTQPYTVTMETLPIAPQAVPGVFSPGIITITTEIPGQTTDTDFWVYDSDLNAIPGYGNDDTPAGFPGAGVNFESTLQANFAAGTYFIAMTNYQYGNNQAAAPNDFQTGNVVDFPDVSANGPIVQTVPLPVSFQISDGVNTVLFPATKQSVFEILWFQFTVGSPTSPTAYCFGNTGNCPCGNIGAAGNGCPHSGNAAGASLGGSGNPSVSGDTLLLTGSGMPNSSALYFQGTTRVNAGNGAIFGDGLRCSGGSVIRLATKTNAGGTSGYPGGVDPPVSVKGMVTAGGCIRTYQCWYRNAASFCNPETFNLTNGVSVTWIP
jgi:hypothetical protein